MDIIQILVKKGLVLQKDVSKIVDEAASSGMTVEEADIASNMLDYIPEDSASHYRFIPISVSNGVLEVGMVNPDDIEARDALNFISSKIGLPFKIFLVTEAD